MQQAGSSNDAVVSAGAPLSLSLLVPQSDTHRRHPEDLDIWAWWDEALLRKYEEELKQVKKSETAEESQG